MARSKKVWTDGLSNPKTATNPKGGGRVRGRIYPHLVSFPGIQAEIRLAWSRMKAQAKFRNEVWNITWQEFQSAWENKWHLRGSEKGSLGMSRIDWEGPWTIDNIVIATRDEHWQRQRKVFNAPGLKRGHYKARKSKCD